MTTNEVIGSSLSRFIRPLRDDEIPQTTQHLLRAVRQMYAELALLSEGPFAWQISAGFTVREHAAQFGKIHPSLRTILKDPRLMDPATQNGILFGAPVGCVSSIGKTADEHLAFLRKCEQKYGLPQGFLGLRTASEHVALILAEAHRKESMGGKFLYTSWIRTSNEFLPQSRLALIYRSEKDPNGPKDWRGINAYNCWNGDGDIQLNVFALGMVPEV